jgi:hypothetical protein
MLAQQIGPRRKLPLFLSDVKAHHDKMVETMLKLHAKSGTLTACSLRPLRNAVRESRGAVSRKPMALSDTLVKVEMSIVEPIW